MWWSACVCALVCVLVCVYWWCACVRERGDVISWAALGVPELPAEWLRGSCSFLFRENPAYWLIRAQRSHPGAPLVGCRLPSGAPALLVCAPGPAAGALRPGAATERRLAAGAHDHAGSLNIFTVKDPLWSIIRRQVSPGLTPGRVRAAAGFTRDRARALRERLQRELHSGNQINLREILTDYTTDIISVAVLGVESDSLSQGNSIIREVTREFQKYDVLRGLTWASIFFWPKLLSILRTTMFPKRAVKLVGLALTIGEKSGGAAAAAGEGKKPRGIKDLLLNLQLPDEYSDIRSSAALSQAVILIQGGYETSSAALCFALLELAHNQEAQERLYSELRAARDRVGELDATTLAELPYLNAVLKETIRLYPPMGWLDRVTSQPLELAGVNVPAGVPLLINAVGMHRDPLYFPDPDRFDPDRFLPENEHIIQPYTYMPFGEGPKACIGRKLGEQTFQFGLSEVVLQYLVSPGAGCPPARRFLWEPRAMFLLPGEPLRLQLTLRGDYDPWL